MVILIGGGGGLELQQRREGNGFSNYHGLCGAQLVLRVFGECEMCSVCGMSECVMRARV